MKINNNGNKKPNHKNTGCLKNIDLGIYYKNIDRRLGDNRKSSLFVTCDVIATSTCFFIWVYFCSC